MRDPERLFAERRKTAAAPSISSKIQNTVDSQPVQGWFKNNAMSILNRH